MGRKAKTGRLRRFARIGLVACAAVVLLIGILLAVVIVPVIPDPVPGYGVRKGNLIEARETGSSLQGETVVSEIRLVSSSGLELDLAVRRSAEDPSPRPLVVMLVGKGTGREAVHLVEDTRGVVLASVDYPYEGDPRPKGLELLRRLPDMQQALINTPPAVMLAIDYLAAQPYVDPERIELVGVSLGAFVASVPGALDTRIRRVWLIHGAGEPARVIAHGLEDDVPFGPARRALGRFLAVVACSHHLGPERWVGRIAPRPVIAINASDDDSLPAESIEALHRALGDPHEIVWMPGGHVLPHRADLIEAIADQIFRRIDTKVGGQEGPGGRPGTSGTLDSIRDHSRGDAGESEDSDWPCIASSESLPGQGFPSAKALSAVL